LLIGSNISTIPLISVISPSPHSIDKFFKLYNPINIVLKYFIYLLTLKYPPKSNFKVCKLDEFLKQSAKAEYYVGKSKEM